MQSSHAHKGFLGPWYWHSPRLAKLPLALRREAWRYVMRCFLVCSIYQQQPGKRNVRLHTVRAREKHSIGPPPCPCPANTVYSPNLWL